MNSIVCAVLTLPASSQSSWPSCLIQQSSNNFCRCVSRIYSQNIEYDCVTNIKYICVKNMITNIKYICVKNMITYIKYICVKTIFTNIKYICHKEGTFVEMICNIFGASRAGCLIQQSRNSFQRFVYMCTRKYTQVCGVYVSYHALYNRAEAVPNGSLRGFLSTMYVWI